MLRTRAGARSAYRPRQPGGPRSGRGWLLSCSAGALIRTPRMDRTGQRAGTWACRISHTSLRPAGRRRSADRPSGVPPGTARSLSRPQRGDACRSAGRIRLRGGRAEACGFSCGPDSVSIRRFSRHRGGRRLWLPGSGRARSGVAARRNLHTGSGPARAGAWHTAHTAPAPRVRRPAAWHAHIRLAGRWHP